MAGRTDPAFAGGTPKVCTKPDCYTASPIFQGCPKRTQPDGKGIPDLMNRATDSRRCSLMAVREQLCMGNCIMLEEHSGTEAGPYIS